MTNEVNKIIPEAQKFVNQTELAARGKLEYSNKDYGHAAANLAGGLSLRANLDYSSDKQREYLKKYVQELVEEFGPNIISFLRDELKLVAEEVFPLSGS